MQPNALLRERTDMLDTIILDIDDTLLAYPQSSPYVGYDYEVLEHLGKQPRQCLMVGDHWTHDIVPAAFVGMGGYWIASTESVPPEPIDRLVGHGRMLDLRALLQDRRGVS